MAENSKIQWTDHTFNPWSGCSKVHEGCAHCYAEVNYSVKMRGVKWGPNGTRVKTANWNEPLKWNRQAEKAGVRKRVFCASLADVFEDWIGEMLDHRGELIKHCYSCRKNGSDGMVCPHCGGTGLADNATMNDLRRDLFALIDATPNLDWLLLTKRPENIRRLWCSHVNTDGLPPSNLHRKNVWLGTSISLQAHADEQIPALLECRNLAAVLFLSCEPLLGPVNLGLSGSHWPNTQWPNALDWVIVGGESGGKARPCDIAWIRAIRDQCQAAGVPCFVKQLGSCPIDTTHCSGSKPEQCLHLADPKGGDWSEWPEELRVREFPA